MNNETQPFQLYHQHELDAWTAVYAAALTTADPIPPRYVADIAVIALRERTVEYRRQMAVEAREQARAASGRRPI